MTTPTDAELLPCPFCGEAAHFEIDDGRWEWVECESCGMQGNRSVSLMEDCKPCLTEAWNLRAPQAVPGAWRSAVLDLIEECPGLTIEQDHWLSRRVKELDFPSAPPPHAVREPLRHEQAKALVAKFGTDPLHLVFQVEVWHGIKGGQHGTDT